MEKRNSSPMKKIAHPAKPALSYFLKLCSNAEFKRQIESLRSKWGIESRSISFEAANKHWLSLCKLDIEDEDYEDKYLIGKTRCQMLEHDLVQLCKAPNVKLSFDMWHVLYTILLCFDLDNMTEDDIFGLPLPPSLARISIAPTAFNPLNEHHLYLDVTFASLQDVPTQWPVVREWQRKLRPLFIKKGYLPNQLKDIRPGAPPVSDDVCRKCAKLHKEKMSYRKIGELYGWPIQRNVYGKRARCRTAEEVVKRGNKLLT